MERRRGARSARDSVTRGAPAAGREAGAGIVEVVIAAVVVIVAVLGAMTAMVSSMGLTRVNHDTAVARQAAQQQLEELQGVPFTEIFAVYNDTTVDDGLAVTPAVGANFAVPGLTPQANDVDGMCGEIWFPVDPATPEELREDVVDAGLGMPRDLDMVGGVEIGVPKSDVYVILPVRVRVQWRGANGNQAVELETVLAQR